MTIAHSPGVASCKTNVVNPFDSDDDENFPPRPLSSSETASSIHSYSNPFDDQAESGPKSSGTKASRRGLSPNFSGCGATFIEKIGGPIQNDHSSFASLSQSCTIPLDNADNEFAVEGEHKLEKTEKFSLRGRASSLGDSALRRAHKLKQNGTQKLKGSALRNGGLKSSNAKQNDPSHHEARDLLLSNGGENDHTSTNLITRSRYDDDYGDLESKSVPELQTIAVQKSEETTSRLHNCLKIAEDIKGDATRTMITLHQQGEQMNRTHEMAVEIDQQLSKGEKMLGSLGGMFSRSWKPKKNRTVRGPVISRNDSFKRRGCHLEQRASLGLVRSNSKGRAQDFVPSRKSQTETVQGKLEVEKQKQDDALSDLSNVLDQLKEMSLDMGSEISSQNEALDHLQNDIVELGDRMKGANARAGRLLGK